MYSTLVIVRLSSGLRHLSARHPRRFAERNVMENLLDLRPRLHPSGLMLAARITLPHFSASSLMSLPKSAGEPASAAAPKSASRAFILGSARATFISLFSLLIISRGVF